MWITSVLQRITGGSQVDHTCAFLYYVRLCSERYSDIEARYLIRTRPLPSRHRIWCTECHRYVKRTQVVIIRMQHCANEWGENRYMCVWYMCMSRGLWVRENNGGWSRCGLKTNIPDKSAKIHVDIFKTACANAFCIKG